MFDARLLRSKISPPRTPEGRVVRPELSDALQAGVSSRLILVAAPAGYGKTTAVLHWLSGQALPYAWFTVDPGDDGLVRFASYVVGAVRTIHPASCERTNALLTSGAVPPPDALAEELAGELADLPESVLVLDDYHAVRDPQVSAFAERLIALIPPSIHLVIACRREPALSLGALRGKGDLAELRARDLRFSEADAKALLESSAGVGLEDDQVVTLVKRTEGWATGLYLAGLSLRRRDDPSSFITAFQTSEDYIVSYLMDEIVARLPDPVRRFLVRTSFLERLCTPLCAAVVSDDGVHTIDGRPMLEWLYDENLFVVSLGGHVRWFRLHALFREVLKHWLDDETDLVERGELHRRAGRWFASERLVDQALEHLLAAGEVAEANALVAAERPEAEADERWGDLELWMGRFPRHVIDHDPELLVTQAWIHHKRFALANLGDTLTRAREELDLRATTPQGEMLRSEIDALSSQFLYWQGDGPGAVAAGRRVMERTGATSPRAIATALIFGSLGLQLQGDTDAARRALRRAAVNRGNASVPVLFLIGIAALELVDGDLTAAQQAADDMMPEARRHALGETLGWAHMVKGLVAYQRHDLDGAEEHFRGVTEHPYACQLNALKESFYGLARIQRARGWLPEALATADGLVQVLGQIGAQWFVPEARAFRFGLEVPYGRLETVPHWLSQFSATEHSASLRLIYEFSPLTLAHALIVAGGAGDLDRADQLLARLAGQAEETANTFRLVQATTLTALLHDARGESDRALSTLAAAVELGRPGGFVRAYADLGTAIAALLDQLLAAGPTDTHVERIRAACLPPTPAAIPQLRPAELAAPAGMSRDIARLLTNREIDVLILLDERLTNKEIARRLFISPATVKRHTLNLYAKLGVHSRRQASLRARELGLIARSS